MSSIGAKEISLKNTSQNDKIKSKIGTTENKKYPNTVYISLRFWVKPKKNFSNENKHKLRKDLEKHIDGILNNEAKSSIKEEQDIFSFPESNIFIKEIPNSINYRNKKNFISIELYLHTCNIKEKEKVSFENNESNKIYKSSKKIIKDIINSDLFNEKKEFEIVQ